MFIKLTNGSLGKEGQILLINKASIVSIFPFHLQTADINSCIYGGVHGSWEVKETTEEIFELLNA
jgi:hypothetical protein